MPYDLWHSHGTQAPEWEILTNSALQQPSLVELHSTDHCFLLLIEQTLHGSNTLRLIGWIITKPKELKQPLGKRKSNLKAIVNSIINQCIKY